MAEPIPQTTHTTVHRSDRAFCAWPFNCGFWRFPGGELLVGFDRSPCDYGMAEQAGHGRVSDEAERVLARSFDGGQTWREEDRVVLWKRGEIYDLLRDRPDVIAPPGPMDFTSPDFCMMSDFGCARRGVPALTGLQRSADRGHTWTQPQKLPTHRFKALYAKDFNVPMPDGRILLFASASYGENWGYDAFPLVYASTDQGVTWHLESLIDHGNPHYTMAYPSPAMVPSGRILAAIRCQMGSAHACWTQIHASDDGGLTWRFLSRVNAHGAPAHIIAQGDGRVLCVYSYRVPPYGVRARISENEGASWGPEWILRDDGGSWDLGYPRIAELESGRICAVYYFNDKSDPIQQEGGVRYIAASTFAPPS
jgi:hypothetical protein